MRKILQWIASLSFVALVLFVIVSSPRWTALGLKALAVGWMERHAEQADRECAEYDDAVKDPAHARGKKVHWFVSHPGKGWLCGDNPNRPIEWNSGPPDMVETGQLGNSRGRRLQATVDSAGPGGVVLAFERFE